MTTRTQAFVEILTIFGVAAVVVGVARRLVRRLFVTASWANTEAAAALERRASGFMRALQLLAFGLAAVASVSFTLERFHIAEPVWNERALARWSVTHGINVAVIIIGAVSLLRAASLAIEHFCQRVSTGYHPGDQEWQRRASTLGGVLTSLANVTVWFVAGLLVLRELSINLMPVLTGAGIAGLAVGLGAQNLLRDMISGFFLILEDQARVGDLARVNTVTGVLEQVNLRTLVLRDLDGAVHVFPNGGITALANLSKQYAFASAELRVRYAQPIGPVIATMQATGAALAADPTFAPLLLGPLEVIGVTSLADGCATVLCKVRTQPLSRDRVAYALRQRLLAAAVRDGLELYVPPR